MTKSVLLTTSNGWGLGHLVRQLAVSGKLPTEIRSTIFTLSQAASVAARPNLEYAPSYSQPWLAKGEWHGGYLRDRLVALAEEVQAEALAFDGVVPYVGLLDAMTHLKLDRIWMRRGLWTAEASRAPLRASSWFDLIIEPGDIADEYDQGPTAGRTDSTKVGVITDANPDTAFAREAAARRLGIDPYRLTLLVNIGSSSIGDLEPLAEVIADNPQWQVVATKDELGRTRKVGNIHLLSGLFPLHPYLKTVDLAVSSVGYNAAHELIAMAVPTIYVPAPTVTDDQFARARAIADQGVGWAVTDRSAETLAQSLKNAMRSHGERQNVIERCRSVRSTWTDGAQESADLISGHPHKAHRESFAQWLSIYGRTWLERNFGDQLRRTQRVWHDEFHLDRTLTRELLASEVPFEHVLPKGSVAYEEKRRVLAEKWLVGQFPE